MHTIIAADHGALIKWDSSSLKSIERIIAPNTTDLCFKVVDFRGKIFWCSDLLVLWTRDETIEEESLREVTDFSVFLK